jgi:hypothetical protein
MTATNGAPHQSIATFYYMLIHNDAAQTYIFYARVRK